MKYFKYTKRDVFNISFVCFVLDIRKTTKERTNAYAKDFDEYSPA